MKDNRKIIDTRYLIVAFVLLVGIGIWQYVEFSKPSVQEKEVLAIATTTDALKTYRNEKYGFEFQYSADLYYEEEVLNEKDFVIHMNADRPGYSLIVTVSPINDYIPGGGKEPSYYDKKTGDLVVYDSIAKQKELDRLKPTTNLNGQGWDSFYVFSNLVIPNKKAGYIVSIDESATPQAEKYLDESYVVDSFKFIN